MASQDSSPVDSQMLEGPWEGAGLTASEESIKLIPKIRPSTTPGLPDYVQYVGHKGLALSAAGAENARWDFDFVASPHTRQSSFFRVAGRPMADHFLAFYNAAIIAYGQTGSGKTHTMLGTVPTGRAAARSTFAGEHYEMPREAGLIPRVLDYIFQRIAAEGQCLPTSSSQSAQLPKQPTAAAPPSQPSQPPQSSQLANAPCRTPSPEGPRPRWRSGIPTPAGLPRPPGSSPPNRSAASPQVAPACPSASASGAPAGSAARTPAAGTTQYLIKASMLQIYQEVVTDLLSPRPIRLQLRESMEGSVTVVGLTEVTVRSAADALKLLRIGTSHRAVAETASNPVSSRSHCILTLHMEAKDTMDTGVVRIRRSRLQLVDLAGSERTAKGQGGETANARQKEANAINKSLSTLGLVINRLSTRSQGPVPYRDSKLTYILQDCLGGNAKTLIIANLNPSPTCASETNMTLGFAIRAKRVRNRAVVNEDHQGDAIVLQGEVRRLREELSIFRTLHAEDGAVPRNMEQLSAWRDQAAARASELRHALELNGELEERLSAVETAHSRLRVEHAALEEQCEKQRCELSAMEATVEQCEAELMELRLRPTLEQYKALKDQLHTANRERSDAQQQHAEVAQQLTALQAQHSELVRSLETLQAQGFSQSRSPVSQASGSGSATARRRVEPARVRELHNAALGLQQKLREESEHLLAALQEQGELRRAADLAFQDAQAALQESHQTAAVAVSLSPSSSSQQRTEAPEATAAADVHLGSRSSIDLLQGSGSFGPYGLAAVLEEDSAGGHGDSLRELWRDWTSADLGEFAEPRTAPESPREGTRVPGSPSTFGAGSSLFSPGRDEVFTGCYYSASKTSSPLQLPQAWPERVESREETEVLPVRHRGSNSGGISGAVAMASPAASSSHGRQPVSKAATHSCSGANGCGEGTQSVASGMHERQLARQHSVGVSEQIIGLLSAPRSVNSRRQATSAPAPALSGTRHGAGSSQANDDTPYSTSRNTLVRVNPLFECREEEPASVGCSDAERDEGDVTGPTPRVTRSGAGSDSIACELPLPPADQIVERWTPWRGKPNSSSPDRRSVAGPMLRNEDEAERDAASVVRVSLFQDDAASLRDAAGEQDAAPSTPRDEASVFAYDSACGKPAQEVQMYGMPTVEAKPRACRLDLWSSIDAPADPAAAETPCSSPPQHSRQAAGSSAAAAGSTTPRHSLHAQHFTEMTPASCGDVSGSPARCILGPSLNGGDTNVTARSTPDMGSMLRSTRRARRRTPKHRYSANCNDENSLCSAYQHAASPAVSSMRTHDATPSVARSPLTPSVTGLTSPKPQRAWFSGPATSNCGGFKSGAANAAVFTPDPVTPTAESMASSPSVSARRHSTPTARSPTASLGGRSVSGRICGGGSAGCTPSPAESLRMEASRLREEVARQRLLAENVEQLEDELAMRLQSEAQLRQKLQNAVADARDDAMRIEVLSHLNAVMSEDLSQRDERLRGFEDLLSRLYGELKTMARQGLVEPCSPSRLQPSSSPAMRKTSPSIVSPQTAIRARYSHTTATDSMPSSPSAWPLSTPRSMPVWGMSTGGSPGNSSILMRSPTRVAVSTMDPAASPGAAPAVGSAAPNSAMAAGLLGLLSKLRDGLAERTQQVTRLEAQLAEARLRVQSFDQGLAAKERTLQERAVSTSPMPPRAAKELEAVASQTSPSGASANQGFVSFDSSPRLSKGVAPLACGEAGPFGDVECVDGRAHGSPLSGGRCSVAGSPGGDGGFIGLLSPVGPDVEDSLLPAPWANSSSAGVDNNHPFGSTTEAADTSAAAEAADTSAAAEAADASAAAEAADAAQESAAAQAETAAAAEAAAAEAAAALEASLVREAGLQAQLENRERQVMELLERTVELESALSERESRLTELQGYTSSLAASRQALLQSRDTQIAELQRQAAEMDAALRAAASEAARLRQQASEALTRSDRQTAEVRAVEYREEMLTSKLRQLEVRFLHRGDELAEMRKELATTNDQLAAMRAQAVQAQVEAAAARQAAAALQDTLDDLRRNSSLAEAGWPQPHQPHHHHHQHDLQPYGAPSLWANPNGGAVRESLRESWLTGLGRPRNVASSGGSDVVALHAHVQAWSTGTGDASNRGSGHGVGGSTGGAATAAAAAREHVVQEEHFVLPGVVPSAPRQQGRWATSTGQVSPTAAVAQATAGVARDPHECVRTAAVYRCSAPGTGPLPPLAPAHIAPGQLAAGHIAFLNAEHAAAQNHAGNKGTWVQRFLYRKGVTQEGSPVAGSAQVATIVTPTKRRKGGVKGIVLRKWVPSASKTKPTRRAR